MNAVRGELHREPASEMDPALGGLDELRSVSVAGVEAGVGVNNANNGLGKGILAIA